MATLTPAGVIAIIKHVPKSVIAADGTISVGKRFEAIGFLDSPIPVIKPLCEVLFDGNAFYTHKSNIKWLFKALKTKDEKTRKRNEKQLRDAKKAVKKGLNKKTDRLAKATKKAKKETAEKPADGMSDARLAC